MRDKFIQKVYDLYMKVNESYTFPIIIKDTNRYGIEFNNELL